MLFSEPKIPQTKRLRQPYRDLAGFSALQRAENSSNAAKHMLQHTAEHVSVLFSEPKIPQIHYLERNQARRLVSVLFSEPKIPQIDNPDVCCYSLPRVSVLFSEPKIPQTSEERKNVVSTPRFSALQRAENSSNKAIAEARRNEAGFSALQRAENSSNVVARRARSRNRGRFQCSSASRKFLKVSLSYRTDGELSSFSALQRAENSSNLVLDDERGAYGRFSALQRAENSSKRNDASLRESQPSVSVLFSEPKIPQIRPSHLRPSIFPTATITLRRS